MKKKFSKHSVSVSIWQRINELESLHKFKSYDGWNQVNGKGEELNRAYGEYDCLMQLTNEFDLPYLTK